MIFDQLEKYDNKWKCYVKNILNLCLLTKNNENFYETRKLHENKQEKELNESKVNKMKFMKKMKTKKCVFAFSFVLLFPVFRMLTQNGRKPLELTIIIP